MSTNRSMDTAFVGGLAWTAGAKFMTQFFSWVAVLVAARLLTPADFGLMEMAGFFFGLTNVLAEFGISTAVLQMHELDRGTLAQLNTASVALCAFAYGCIVLAAPLAATFFRTDRLELLIIVNSGALVITGFQAVPVGLLQKDMDYRRLSVADAVQALLQAVVTIVCAIAGFKYWSLVAGAGAGKLTAAIMTFCWKPSRFAIPRWKQIEAPMRLGWHVAISRVAWAAYNQSDSIIIGRTLGDAVLGAYRLALNLASAPAEKIGTLIMRVTGPLFAKVQQDNEAVRRYFKIFSESLTLTIFPLMVGLTVVAPEAVKVILGPKWDAAILPLRWLAIFIGARTLNGLAQQSLTSLRYTRFNMWTSLASFIVMPIGFYFASRWGAGAVAATWVILSPVTVLPPVVKLLKVVGLSYREYWGVLMPALTGSFVMLAALLTLRFWFRESDTRPVIGLVVQVTAGSIVYAAFLLTFYRERVVRYTRFLLDLRKGSPVLATSNS
jgi:PST family polysaccharide transporter